MSHTTLLDAVMREDTQARHPHRPTSGPRGELRDQAYMSPTRRTTSPTLGPELDRDHLERRISRIGVAITWLRQYNGDRQGVGQVPQRYVRQAITDFEAQIVAMNARLRELPPKRTAPASRNGPAGTRSALTRAALERDRW